MQFRAGTAPSLPCGHPVGWTRDGRWTQGRTTVIAALMLTFLVLALFAVLAVVQTRFLTHDATRTVRQSDLYQKVRYWVGTEKSLERRYRLQPSAATEAQHAKAASNVTMVLRAAHDNSAPAEQTRVTALMELHEQYMTAIRSSLFPAVRTRDQQHVSNIDRVMVLPVFAQLEQRIDAEARAHRQQASAQLAHLNRLLDTLAVLAPVVFVAGLGILVVLWRVLLRKQRVLDDAHETALNRLRAESITDPLTRLGNHRAFQEGLGAALRLGALDGTPLTLARLDLDEFKVVNDRGGHLHGDQVLSSVGHLLGMAFQGRAYRVGGDEFALLLPVTSEHAARVIDDLRGQLAAANLPTISAGLTTTIPGTTAIATDDLHQQADQALREAKRRGRNRQVSFQQVAGRSSVLGLEQVDALRHLIQGGHMNVAFQPIWQLCVPGHTSIPLAFEALARPAAEAGFRDTQELFDVAARVNRSAALDHLCIRTALARAHGLPDGALLFLNVSPQTLDQDISLATLLLDEVGAVGLAPQRVVIEITERSTGNMAAVLQQVGSLRAAGFQIALDDLGAGNAGLEMLRCLPVDFVKIDRSVVAAAPDDVTANAVLSAIMAYARTTGVKVIVEGLETTRVLQHAWHLGARFAQGYLLGRPAPGFEVTPLSGLVTGTGHSTPEGGAPQHSLHP